MASGSASSARRDPLEDERAAIEASQLRSLPPEVVAGLTADASRLCVPASSILQDRQEAGMGRQGAITARQEDMQQKALPAIHLMFAIIPARSTRSTNPTTATVIASFVPITAPAVMPIRDAVIGVALWGHSGANHCTWSTWARRWPRPRRSALVTGLAAGGYARVA